MRRRGRAGRDVIDELAAGAALVHDQLAPPAGASIAIFGCDLDGLGAILAAADRGCHPIVVVDEDPQRLLRACELGATHVIDPGADDPVAAIRSLRGNGVRFLVDTTGAAPTRDCLAWFGSATVTGRPILPRAA